MWTKGVFLLGLVIYWTAECNCEYGSKNDYRLRDKLSKLLAEEEFMLSDVKVGAECTQNEDCGDREKCTVDKDPNICECADGLSGETCEVEEACKITGTLKDCNGENGTCEYKSEERKVVCTCTVEGTKIHPDENRCRATCTNVEDCNNRGTCDDDFCTCKEGFIGDKCETIFDCTPEGKFRGCVSSGGSCFHDGTNAVCECKDSKKYHGIDHVCKATCSNNEDCYNRGTCDDDFCTCKPGLIGDKCETIPECLSDGKYRGCANSGGNCTHDGTSAVCVCPVNQKYHDTDHTCKDTCDTDANCNDNQTCKEISKWKTCTCAAGLSGKYCEKKDWCEGSGQFANCKGINGTCEYAKYERSVVCNCEAGKELHPTENRCRDKCAGDNDCKNTGTCKDNFCSCKAGLFGDKCETIFDCTEKGKFRGCEESKGKCTHDGNNAMCTCLVNQQYHDTENICKECSCGSNGRCKFEKGQKKCDCDSGFAVKNEICTATCTKDGDCKEEQKCVDKDGWKTCVCADGLSGANCEKKDWCEATGKFKNCKGDNGTCQYVKDKRSVDCTCASGKALDTVENRCRDTCTTNDDCNNGGTCENSFCTCKLGLFGDKCETIFDCTTAGKYKDCASSGGTCTYDGTNAVCSCSGNKKLHETENICKAKCANSDECQNGGTCDNEICTCTAGLTGDKCEKIIDCEANGKYKNCKSAGGNCTFDGTNAVCTCPTNKKYHEKEHTCKSTCSIDDDCNDNQACKKINDWNTCVCADGLSGDNCKKNDWCEGAGKFKNCKGINGTCEYVKDKRSVVCTCTSGKEVHPTENRCRDTCASNDDCKNGGTCENNFCTCKLGFIGDKCETVFDCSPQGKYKGCTSSGGKCTHDGTNAICECPENKKLHDNKHICEDCNCGPNGVCKFENGQKKCDCDPGFAVKGGICTATCVNNDGCKDNQACKDISGWKTCVCADGLSGDNCEKNNWCETTGKFKNCKGVNGTCEYVKDKRAVDCICDAGRELNPAENRCRETCSVSEDCKNKGTCNGKFCFCKPGLFGDKCETVFDCTPMGKYKGCESSSGTCTYDGNKGVCTCPDHKRLHETEHICKDFCSTKEDCNGGDCLGPDDKKICSCIKGLKGDRCEIVVDCVEGKLSKCGTSGGECKFVFEEKAAECICSGSKALDKTKNICREKCDNDCKNEGTCNASTKLCNCKTGTSGDKCETIDACSTLKCEDKDAKCIFKNGVATCECNDKSYYFKDNKCEAKWCIDGCSKDSVCVYMDGVGFCFCDKEGAYYNYGAGKCETIDKCFNITCGEGQVCSNGACVCDGNHITKEDKCEAKNFCDKGNNKCFPGAHCEISSPVGYVRCSCNGTNFYNTKKRICEDGACFLPAHKKDCKKRCPRDMERKEGVCKHKTENTACSKECGTLGWCYKVSETSQICVCEPDIAENDKNGKCVLKASAVCPTSEKEGDDKCKCKGKYKAANGGITCELKSCSDEEVKAECNSRRAAKCVDNWRNDGYKCVCPDGYIDDPNKGCIDPCSMDSMKEDCLSKGKVCLVGNKVKVGDCKCLPTFIENPTSGTCEPNGKNTVMIQSLPVISKKYEVADKSINKVLLHSDVSTTMKQTFKNLDFAYVYSFKLQEAVLLCDVWLQFKVDGLPENFNASLEVKRWKSLVQEANNQKILPPSLYLNNSLNAATEEELTLCSTAVQQSICGRGSSCVNNKCTCIENYREIDSTIKSYGDKGRIVRCEAIDVCKEGTHKCPDNSKCINLEGDYFCRCNSGYRKKEGAADEIDKKECIGLCEVNPCVKGECKITKENTVDCSCQVGYSGSFCNKKDERLTKANQSTKVVGAVLGTLLAIVIVLIIVYILRQRKNSYSEDFTPPPRNDNAEMIERRPMRGVTNRAYQ